MNARFIILVLASLFLFGCATSTKYDWGNYEGSLYKHYKNPAEQEKYVLALASVIEDGEKSGRVPPGIYAEYGYMLYTTGRNADSISYFEKEKKAWPESTLLMDRMIASAKKATADKVSVGVGK